jgi:hypothetical protein
MKSRKFLIAAPILALALAAGGTAWAAGGGGWGGPHNGAHGYGPHGSLRWGFGRDSAPLGIVAGLNTSSTPNVLSITEFDGTTATYDVSSNTQYFLNGVKGSSTSVVAGENVVVFAGRNWGGWSGSTASTTPTAQVVYLFSPHVFGSVQSVTTNSTGQLIVVQDPQGFWHSIQTSSTTVYYSNGTSSTTAPTFTTGEIIAALGSVGTDHLTLDATQVNVVTLHHHHSH